MSAIVADHRVAHQVAVRVVDRLEVVDVDHQQADRERVALRALQFLLDARVKISAVEQAAHRIDRGGLGVGSRLREGPLAPEREGERRRQRAQRREIAPGERPAVGAIGDAQHAQHFGRRRNGHRGEGIRPIPRSRLPRAVEGRDVRHPKRHAGLIDRAHDADASRDAEMLDELHRIADRRHDPKHLTVGVGDGERGDLRAHGARGVAHGEVGDARVAGRPRQRTREAMRRDANLRRRGEGVHAIGAQQAFAHLTQRRSRERPVAV